MFNVKDQTRDELMLERGLSRCGYDWWWHSFTARNAVTGQERPFFFEFFVCNPALGGDKPVFGQLPENKAQGRKPSYLMVKAGSWGSDAAQLHRFFVYNDVSINAKAPYSIKAGDCYVDEFSSSGHICISDADAKDHPEWMCDGGEMSWNLKIDKQVAFNVGYGAGKLFRYLQAFNMFWHAQGMKTFYSGEVYWKGEKYIVEPETCYGYADKNWGKDFTSPWVWLSSNNLVSKISGKRLNDSVFDIGGGCPKVGPIAFQRKLLSAFWYEGKAYEFNFSKFWTRTRTVFDCRETETQIVWHVEQSTWTNRMVTDITCEKSDMLLVNYEAPDGKKRHNRLWNGGNGKGTISLYHKGQLIDTVEARNIGCEYGEYDR